MQHSNDSVLLAHGGGGRLSGELLRRCILPHIENETLAKLGDSARLDLDCRCVFFTTDSYVVKPLFFSGGDIGKLAICGTINDLAVAGARPVALSLALIIEEGLPIEQLERVLASVGETARKAGVAVVTGDTKTVEAGAADQMFINTAGIGVRLDGVELGLDRVSPGDKIIVSGTIGDHGMTIMSLRKEIRFKSELRSDCAALSGLTARLLTESNGVRFMRDPTRGGLAATLNEIAAGSGCGIVVREADIPIDPTVQAAADALGFDVMDIANEGKLVAVVTPGEAANCLGICRRDPLGARAAIVGEVGQRHTAPLAEIVTKVGGRRIVQMPYGRELPRIC